MIDSTKSPAPVWRKYLTIVVLSALIVVAVYLVWTKELHKSSSNPTSTPTTVTVPAKVTPTKAPVTTVPGGVPISNRNPFGG
jgi:hypothetical protein